MNMNRKKALSWEARIGWLIMTIMLFVPAQARAAESLSTESPSFRVETDIYEGTETKPQSQHLILFDAGVIYDTPIGLGAVITVFDIPRGRVVLVHKANRVRTSIPTDTLIQMAAQMRAEVAASKAKEALGLEAKVLPGSEPDSYVVEFGDSKYFATTQKVANPLIAEEYAAFTSWASRLNIARHMGSPPFARILLAEQMAIEHQLPRVVKLDVRRAFKTRSIRAEHLVVERISELDRKRIGEIGGMISAYEEVEFTNFPMD